MLRVFFINMKKNILIITVVTVVIGMGVVTFFLKKQAIINPDIQNVLGSKNIYGFQVQEKMGYPEFLIVNFWASWCPPCIQEIPSLAKFVQMNPKYKVVAVSQDDALPEIKNVLTHNYFLSRKL